MHPHRVALLIAAALGTLVIVLPWANVLGMLTLGYQHGPVKIACAVVALSALMSVAGKRLEPLGLVARLVVALLALIGLGIGAINYHGLRGEAAGAERFAQALVGPGYGMFLLIVSSAVLFLLALIPSSWVAGNSRTPSASGVQT